MWTRAATRRELIEIIQSERAEDPGHRLFSNFGFTSTTSLSPRNDSELLLVWRDDPRDLCTLPNVIVTPSDQRDFFAWAATYVKPLRPLTAYIRISTFELAEQALSLQTNPTLR